MNWLWSKLEDNRQQQHQTTKPNIYSMYITYNGFLKVKKHVKKEQTNKQTTFELIKAQQYD